MDARQVIAGYRKLRERKEALEAKHKEELAPITEGLRKMEAWLAREMERTKLTKLPTESGTAYQQEVVSVSVEDFDTFLNWVWLHNAWEFLEKRASKTAVQEYVQSKLQEFKDRKEKKAGVLEMVPPGLKYGTTTVVRVRK